MIEKTIKLEDPVEDRHYRAWFRCSNCGVIFQHDMIKGELASTIKATCPMCSVRSGSVTVGVFPIIKYNPDQDQIPQRHYFK